MESAADVVILAAGKGRRMKSQIPKVLCPVLGRPMLHYVLDSAFSLPHRAVYVVVGFGEEQVRQSCRDYAGVRFVRQAEQLGTAHAVKMVEAELAGRDGTTLVLCGDVILIRPDTIRKMLSRHQNDGAACTIGTAVLEAPEGYGRVIRDGDRVIAIKEELDCTEQERLVREVNAGVYCFDTRALFDALRVVGADNAQKEYYLPDAVKLIAARAPVRRFAFDDPREVLGVNDPYAHWQVESVMRERRCSELMLSGARLLDPRGLSIDAASVVDPGAVIEQGVTLINSRIGAGAHVEAYCRIVDSQIGGDCRVRQGSYLEGSVVASGCQVGPYARLRPGTRLESGVKIGNFVEVKNSVFGERSQASHLAYIGDAEIGRRVNLGCGFITCNYDGVAKHKTVVEDDAFVGSDTQAVAPVRIGAGSYVASGTCVTQDVPPQSLAIGRGRQVNKEGYARKYRRKDAKAS